MARQPRVAPPEPQALYRCVAPFSVFRNGVPVVYGGHDEVMGDDPILRTHLHHFEPATARVLKRSRGVEQATAAPGELRSSVLPPASRTIITDEESTP